MPAAHIHDHELITAVETLYQDPDNRDPAEGGVHATVVAEELGISPSTAKDRLLQLAQDDQLAQYDGLHPDTYRHRKSYAPVDENAWGEGSTPRS